MTEERGRNKTRNETNKERRQEVEGGIEEGKISCGTANFSRWKQTFVLPRPAECSQSSLEGNLSMFVYQNERLSHFG